MNTLQLVSIRLQELTALPCGHSRVISLWHGGQGVEQVAPHLNKRKAIQNYMKNLRYAIYTSFSLYAHI